MALSREGKASCSGERGTSGSSCRSTSSCAQWWSTSTAPTSSRSFAGPPGSAPGLRARAHDEDLPLTNLTRGSLLARNVVWNLLGNGAPMIVAVFSIPVLIHGLGKDRFGVLALAWGLIGYASMFDLGLGRALTQLVAKKLGAGEEREVPSIVWTSLLLMLLLGLAAAAVIVLASPSLVERVLSIPPALRSETLRAFYLLALSIPLTIGTVGLRGMLEAHQRFDLINALRIPMGVFTYAGPLLVLPFSRSLFPVVLAG